jgi:hypothetical protein
MELYVYFFVNLELNIDFCCYYSPRGSELVKLWRKIWLDEEGLSEIIQARVNRFDDYGFGWRFAKFALAKAEEEIRSMTDMNDRQSKFRLIDEFARISADSLLWKTLHTEVSEGLTRRKLRKIAATFLAIVLTDETGQGIIDFGNEVNLTRDVTITEETKENMVYIVGQVGITARVVVPRLHYRAQENQTNGPYYLKKEAGTAVLRTAVLHAKLLRLADNL